MINYLESMIYHLDEPQADPAPLNALMICKLARQHDIKVLLSGAGGDDIFSGYRRHFALCQESRWTWMPSAVRRLLKHSAGLLPRQHAVPRRIAKALQYADLPDAQRLISYFFWMNPADQFPLLLPGARDQLGGYHPEEPMLDSLSKLEQGVHPLNQMLYLETRHFLADHNLNYTDKMGMAVGVEVRVPLLDPNLVEWATSVPVHMKQRGQMGL